MRQAWGAGLVGALVVVNAGLLTALVRADTDPPAPTSSAPATAPTDATSAPTGDADTVDPAGVLHLADDGTLLRSWRGTCATAEQTRLELSRDGGVGFDEVALPIDADDSLVLRTVLDLTADSADDITIVGNDDACETRVFTTDDGGETWESTETYGEWYVPAAADEVISPDGPVQPGCVAVAVDAVSEINAKVVCQDARVLGTNDAGETWIFLGVLDGARDLTFDTISEGAALATTEGCASAVFASVDGGETWQQQGCATEDAEGASLVRRGETLLLSLEAGRVLVSDDDGQTWEDVDAAEDSAEDEDS